MVIKLYVIGDSKLKCRLQIFLGLACSDVRRVAAQIFYTALNLLLLIKR